MTITGQKLTIQNSFVENVTVLTRINQACIDRLIVPTFIRGTFVLHVINHMLEMLILSYIESNTTNPLSYNRDQKTSPWIMSLKLRPVLQNNTQ